MGYAAKVENKYAKVYDTKTRALVGVFGMGQVTQAVCNSDEEVVVTESNGTVRVYNIKTKSFKVI